MSSHHIVREKQEPALLVLGLNSFSDELLGQLLEWSPTVIVTDETAESVNAYGIKIDWIIADRFNDQLQSDMKWMPAGDGELVENALNYLITHGYPAVNIITDELQLNDYISFCDKIDMVIFYNYKKIYCISSGFSKWKPAGEVIEFFTDPEHLHCSGLTMLSHSRYKTTLDGFFSVQFEQPFLFIAEEI